MDCAAKQRASTRVIQAFLRPHTTATIRHRPSSFSIHQHHQRIRHASSTSDPSKPIVLEKPDKFRPPSHAARRNARSTTGMYGTGAAYNQGMTVKEREQSQRKQYPHMFPAEGTRMHWFLTNKNIHLLISMGVLITLAITTMISTWSQTSPYAHLIPPINMLIWHPWKYFSDLYSVWHLHHEYETQKVWERRQQGTLDAQKRRLYRRAHGMEDLDADEGEGVDVRGLVEWDDGLTNPERARGGIRHEIVIGQRMQELGQRPNETLPELQERLRREQMAAREAKEEKKRRKAEEDERAEEERLIRIRARRLDDEERPRRKVWFGIWG
ncbi:hypothetical protein LTR64_000065 [Lithohypha guttulata]|uniref:uncharacterized protein n=1 Tax=Lithohypha guttulata TaxID=1690604 RepID=UPI002DDEDFB4|nr:hypothetical protein LTR51_007427 [Lithohypha guttulata]